jgi:hypothetical protein
MDAATTFRSYKIGGQVALNLPCIFRVFLLCTRVMDTMVAVFGWSDAPVDEATTCDFEKRPKVVSDRHLEFRALPE